MATKKKAAKKKAAAQKVLRNNEYAITEDQLSSLRDIITEFNTTISGQIKNAVRGEDDLSMIGYELGRLDKDLDSLVERGTSILDDVNPEAVLSWYSDDEDEDSDDN